MAEIPDILETIAEISLGLAGFSGLIVALRRNAGPLDDIWKYRMSVLFALAFGAMFLALVPSLLVNLGAGEARVWRYSATAFSGYSLLFMLWWIVPSRRVARVVPEIFNWRAFNTMLAGHIVILVLQLALIFGLFTGRESGIFTLGLAWYLLHATQQFIRMLFISPRKTE